MTAALTRRALIAGALGTMAGAAMADAPLVALRPMARPGSVIPPSGAEIAARSGLSGQVGLALADADTGEILELVGASAALPPASVMKSFTALYARDRLGPDFRFATRVMATGPVVDGVLDGDLILAGGGDPVLITDDLATLAARMAEAGLREVRGRFLVWGGALPYIHEIDTRQLQHLGYNPAVCGLNLNFNRVHFEWAPQGGDYRVSMDARSNNYRPDVAVARMRVENRDLPVYTYADEGGADAWTVARSALGEGGSRWLPVRKPALYAGDVFRTMALSQGIRLTAAEEVGALPASSEIARIESPPLEVMIADMLEYSTNITAEALGLMASMAAGNQPESLKDSADQMRGWAQERLGAAGVFADHSGLSDQSAVTAADLVTGLTAAAQDGAIIRLMKDIVMLDDRGDALPRPPAVVRAKTGTLNFVSALAGYIIVPGGRRLAFAILTADADRRAVAQATGDEVPAGAREWGRASRRLQQQLLRGWAASHG